MAKSNAFDTPNFTERVSLRREAQAEIVPAL
jgi:hypothetical protein